MTLSQIVAYWAGTSLLEHAEYMQPPPIPWARQQVCALGQSEQVPVMPVPPDPVPADPVLPPPLVPAEPVVPLPPPDAPSLPVIPVPPSPPPEELLQPTEAMTNAAASTARTKIAFAYPDILPPESATIAHPSFGALPPSGSQTASRS
jgi:hypothetical protein